MADARRASRRSVRQLLRRRSHRERNTLMGFILGLDLGQANDWTALTVIEQTEIAGAPENALFRYDIRHCDRVRRVPFDKIAERVRDLVERLAESVVLVVDKTGLGAPVNNILEMVGVQAQIVPVTITGGNEA